MRAAAATAGMLSAAVLLGPGCGTGMRGEEAQSGDPVRRAAFRALAARQFLASCPGAESRRETAYQDGRLDQLKRLAAAKDAGSSIGLGENDWAGVSRYADRERCGPGERAYGEALARFSHALDALAARIADHRQ